MDQIMSLLNQYHLYLMGAVFVGSFFLSREFTGKIIVRFLIVLLGISIAYEVIMDEPVTRMPARINQTLNQSGPEKSENLHYHKTPETRSEEHGNPKGDFQTMD
jgi:uncharacterized membrane protein